MDYNSHLRERDGRGDSVGVDVTAEILDNHKTAQEVFDLISKRTPNG
jgi:hypothetical protein